MKIYSLKVKSLKIYNIPFVASDDGHALQIVKTSVEKGCNDGQSINIEDLSLFQVGEFDSKEAIKHSRPKQIIDLIKIPGLAELVKKVEEVTENV